MAKAKAVGEQLYQLRQERSIDLERFQEKESQLWDRWQRVCTQIETRHTELESIQEVLSDYRQCHSALIQWIEEITIQQELMKPGQAEDSRVLSEQLSQQTALAAEIEKNQAKLDQCQKFSQQYSAAVKDYELQLMTYRAFVESQQKSPMKRRRMLSSSDAITQEFMDLRTRYTALVTLTTQHVKYISDALRRLEEEEKVVEEEKQEHVDKVKELLGWASGLRQSVQGRTAAARSSRELGDIEKSISEQQALNEELAAKKEQVSEAIKTSQIFLAKHSHKLSHQEKEQISAQIAALKDTYQTLCSDSTEQLQQLQSQLAQEAEHKVLVPARPAGRTAQGPPQGVSTVVLGCVSHGHSCPSAFLLRCPCCPVLVSTLPLCPIPPLQCTKLGSHLSTLLEHYQQFQEVAESLRTWLQDSEAAVGKLLSETVSSDPATLQQQLASAGQLQGNLAEHQVPVEKLQKAARSLLEIQGEPAPDHRHVQETTDAIVSRYQSLSQQMAERSDLLQKSIAQSQSVQESLESLLQSVAEIEKSLGGEQPAALSSTSIQDSLATNAKLKQDIARQKSCLEATREMVTRFTEAADSATASALQGKLAEVTEHFGRLCQQQQEKEEALKGLLPKVEQYEQLSEKLQQFTESRARMLASGNQPDRDIARFSQHIQELNLELKQHQEDLAALEHLAAELGSCGFAPGASLQQEKLQSLKKEFLQLQKVAEER
uniref:Uncharacterized protein n=1 Tax=Anas zonorhyncha TaxID=75864 RepID=A0A8B9UZI8_9AVES